MIAQSLTNLTQHLAIPVHKHPGQPKRGPFKCALEGTLITYKFGNKKCQAFMKLKCILTMESVLKSLVYNGLSFVITTDEAKLGFGAVLAQWFEFIKKMVRW